RNTRVHRLDAPFGAPPPSLLGEHPGIAWQTSDACASRERGCLSPTLWSHPRRQAADTKERSVKTAVPHLNASRNGADTPPIISPTIGATRPDVAGAVEE